MRVKIQFVQTHYAHYTVKNGVKSEFAQKNQMNTYKIKAVVSNGMRICRKYYLINTAPCSHSISIWTVCSHHYLLTRSVRVLKMKNFILVSNCFFFFIILLLKQIDFIISKTYASK